MFLIGLVFCFVSFPLFSMTQVESGVFAIDYGKSANDEILVLLNSGLVLKAPTSKSDILAKLTVSKNKNEIYHFNFDEKRIITDVAQTQSIPAIKNVQKFLSPRDAYIPTTISSMDVARRYFREARYNPKESQCFNRATVWTYEWWRKHSLKSNKLLIFFTRNYIRRYNFEWWFHISPYVHVLDNGKVVERVMDVKYTSAPLEFRTWTNIFMNRDPECPVITKFSEYADNPYLGDCYIQRTNMYTYQPADLQMYEAWDYKKDNFVMDEVRQAYLEAFNERLSESEGE